MESGSEPQDTDELHDRMAELQTEMFRLEIQKRKLNNLHHANETAAEYLHQCKPYQGDNNKTDLTIT